MSRHGWVMLRPIGFQSLDEALPLLARGFPCMPPARWAAGVARLKRHGARVPDAPAGYLLETGGRNVGVILSIPSQRRPQHAPPQSIVNLSSWYIDPEHRWRAPRMLQRVVACERTLYTDLTPTEPVRAMIGRFGFRGWTEGTLIFALPWFAIKRARESVVVPLHRLPQDAFAPDVRTILDDHAALDCMACALWDGTTLHPLVFSRTTRHGLAVARLVYAESRAIVSAHIAAIARFLLRERLLLLAVNGNRDERIPGSVFTQRPAPAFFKGRHAPAPCDFAYSEYVFLQV